MNPLFTLSYVQNSNILLVIFRNQNLKYDPSYVSKIYLNKEVIKKYLEKSMGSSKRLSYYELMVQTEFPVTLYPILDWKLLGTVIILIWGTRKGEDLCYPYVKAVLHNSFVLTHCK